MHVNVNIYAKPGKNGDKIWCCFNFNGEPYTAHGPTGIPNVNSSTPSTLAFRNISLIKNNNIKKILDSKLKSGYTYVDEYLLDIETKTAGRTDSLRNSTASVSVPKAKPLSTRQPIKTGRLSPGTAWAW